MNEYKTTWTLIQIDKKPTKKIIKEISKFIPFANFCKNGLYYHDHHENREAIISILKKEKRSGVMITITDKQFGLSYSSPNNEKGILEQKGKIFKAHIHFEPLGLGLYRTFPVSTKQIQDAIVF